MDFLDLMDSLDIELLSRKMKKEPLAFPPFLFLIGADMLDLKDLLEKELLPK